MFSLIRSRDARSRLAKLTTGVEHDIVIDIGGTGAPAVRRLGAFGEVFVVPVNLNRKVAAGLIVDGVSLGNLLPCSVDGIFSSHMIEHVPYTDARRMFTRWAEVLKPRGRLEIRCPDARWAATTHFNEGAISAVMFTEIMLGKRVPGEPFYQWCHQNLWWYDKLATELVAAGFQSVERLQGTEKYLDWWPYDLSDVTRHGYPIPDLRVSAVKPA